MSPLGDDLLLHSPGLSAFSRAVSSAPGCPLLPFALTVPTCDQASLDSPILQELLLRSPPPLAPPLAGSGAPLLCSHGTPGLLPARCSSPLGTACPHVTPTPDLDREHRRQNWVWHISPPRPSTERHTAAFRYESRRGREGETEGLSLGTLRAQLLTFLSLFLWQHAQTRPGTSSTPRRESDPGGQKPAGDGD